MAHTDNHFETSCAFGGLACTPILLIGPSTCGKTDLAFLLAERIGGEIINADKFYLYQGFPSTTGLPDFAQHPTVPAHLYSVLSPEQPCLDERQYASLVTATIADVASRGATPIIEGCYHRFARAVLDLVPCSSWIVAGITWSRSTHVPDLVERRVKDIFYRRGGIDEVRAGLQRGYRDTYVMRSGSMVRPLVEYLDGQISLELAETKAVAEILSSAYKALRRFLDFPAITWHENDQTIAPLVVQKLVQHIAVARDSRPSR